MKIRQPYIMSVKVPWAHIEKLDDISAHDGVTRSTLVRAAIARLIRGRKAVLYNDKETNNDDTQ